MSDASRRLPPKKEVALALLEGSSLFIHLDPRRSGVAVPKWLLGQPQLVLQVGLNMAIQIPDLTVDDDGVTCTLSFNRSPFWCKLPWTAVYALVGEDGRGMIWPNDVPPEVATQMQKSTPPAPPQASTPAPAKPQAVGKKVKPKLAAVADADAPKSARPRTRPEAAPKAASPPARSEADAKPSEPVRPSARPRRVPVAVPALASADAADRGRAATEPESKIPEAPSRDTGPRKPRRELPPYLRVVK